MPAISLLKFLESSKNYFVSLQDPLYLSRSHSAWLLYCQSSPQSSIVAIAHGRYIVRIAYNHRSFTEAKAAGRCYIKHSLVAIYQLRLSHFLFNSLSLISEFASIQKKLSFKSTHLCRAQKRRKSTQKKNIIHNRNLDTLQSH